MKLTKLSEAQFNELAGHTRLKENARNFAFEVLVSGRQAAEVAEQYGVSRNAVKQAIQSIEKAFAAHGDHGTAWISANLEIPTVLAKEIAHLAALLKQNQDAEKQEKALGSVTAALSKASRILEN